MNEKLYIVTWILNGEPDSFATPNFAGADELARVYDKAGALVFWHEVCPTVNATVPTAGAPRPPVLPIHTPDIEDNVAVDLLLEKIRRWGEPMGDYETQVAIRVGRALVDADSPAAPPPDPAEDASLVSFMYSSIYTA